MDLKREIDVLKAKLAESVRQASPVKKRKKAVDEDVVLVPRSPKRSKRDVSPSRSGVVPIEAINDFDFSTVGEIGAFSSCNQHDARA